MRLLAEFIEEKMNKNLNLPTCDFCEEDDCIIGLDGRCEQIRKYERYLFLRNNKLDTENIGVFAGKIPDNIIVLNGEDLDIEINKAMYS